MGKIGSAAPPPTLDPERHALFLDYDGTLVEIAPTPAEATADPSLLHLLGKLHDRFRGALAIVTGRAVADIDRLLTPLRLTVSGLHGLVCRQHDGRLCIADLPSGLLDPAREAFADFVARHPGTLFEDKELSVALHYRLAPDRAEAATSLAEGLAETVGGLRLQRGKMVVELLPRGYDKGHAISQLLSKDDFKGRIPVFAGDDITDNAGFQAVNELGGISVHVGPAASIATYNVPDVTELRYWISSI